MDITKFRWLVNWGRLFMPSASRLSDPFEGTTPEGDLEWWRREASNADSEEQRRIIEYNREFLSRMAKGFRNNYYVSCWHMSQYENHAMWRCYTTKPEAVAIKTSYELLRLCLPNYVEAGMVRYIDYATERLPTMNMFEYITHKDAYYHFEHEVRAVAFPPVGHELDGAHFRENHFELEGSPGFLVYAPPIDIKHLVNGVVLHPEAPLAFETEVIGICAKNGLPQPEPSRSTRKPVF